MTIYCQRWNRRGRLLATKLAIQIQLKVVYMKVSGRASTLLQYSCMMLKTWMMLRHYACYRSTTLQKLTFILKVSQSFKPCLIVLFGVLLFHLVANSSHVHTGGSREYKGHLQLKHSTAERH